MIEGAGGKASRWREGEGWRRGLGRSKKSKRLKAGVDVHGDDEVNDWRQKVLV